MIRLSFNTIACDDVSLFEQSLKGALVNTFSQVGFPEVDSFDLELSAHAPLVRVGLADI